MLEADEWVKGHCLNDIFNKLPDKRKQVIRELVAKAPAEAQALRENLDALRADGMHITWEVDALLEMSFDAFRTWRYAFEQTPGCFSGYSEIQKPISQQIAEICRLPLEKPDWASGQTSVLSDAFVANALAGEGLAQAALVMLVKNGIICASIAADQVEQLAQAHSQAGTSINQLTAAKVAEFANALRATKVSSQ